MKVGSVVMGMMLWMGAETARAQGLQGGLTGLDTGMNRTGRVGNLSPRSDARIGLASTSDQDSVRISPVSLAARVPRTENLVARQSADLSEEEVLQTDKPVANCRIEVARRRRVAPAQVLAGSVVLRFTVEPSGRVRDAEAVSQTNTDLEVAACAKRVLSNWTFAKHATGEIKTERVYRLADVRLMARADR